MKTCRPLDRWWRPGSAEAYHREWSSRTSWRRINRKDWAPAFAGASRGCPGMDVGNLKAVVRSLFRRMATCLFQDDFTFCFCLGEFPSYRSNPRTIRWRGCIYWIKWLMKWERRKDNRKWNDTMMGKPQQQVWGKGKVITIKVWPINYKDCALFRKQGAPHRNVQKTNSKEEKKKGARCYGSVRQHARAQVDTLSGGGEVWWNEELRGGMGRTLGKKGVPVTPCNASKRREALRGRRGGNGRTTGATTKKSKKTKRRVSITDDVGIVWRRGDGGRR